MRTKQGIVTSAKMQNTVTVTVHRNVMDDKYAKRFRVSRKFLADTNKMDVGEGDEVIIAECKPLSKRKYFKVQEILKKAPVLANMKEEDVEKSVKRDHRDRLATKEDVSTPQS